MSNNHPIVAQPWQMKSNLGAVLMPLLPEPELGKDGAWRINGEYLYKIDTRIIRDKVYVDLPWQVGDRIYLQEEWCSYEETAAVDAGYILKSQEFPSLHGFWCWQPAHTMPPEAAQFWYEITSLEVTQAKALDMPTLIESKLTYWGDLREDPRLLESEVVHYWNKCHPEHPWYGDRYVVILRIRFCSSED